MEHQKNGEPYEVGNSQVRF